MNSVSRIYTVRLQVTEELLPTCPQFYLLQNFLVKALADLIDQR